MAKYLSGYSRNVLFNEWQWRGFWKLMENDTENDNAQT